MEPRIPKRITNLVDRVRATGPIVKTMPTFSFGETTVRWQYANGRDAPELSVRQAIDRGLLVPQNDGLFGSDTSQTYAAV